MSLVEQAEATRIIAEALCEHAGQAPQPAAIVCQNLGIALANAADRMEAKARADLAEAYPTHRQKREA